MKRTITYEGPNVKRVKSETRFPFRKSYAKVKASKGLVKTIEKVVSKNEEVKESSQYSLNTPLAPSNNAGWVASSIPICPYATGFVISQGAGQGQRIGNQIRTKKCWVKGIIHPNIQDPTTNIQPLPIQIRMILFKDKFNKSSQPSAVGIDLFQNGSTVLPPQNDLCDMILDINKDRYTVYHDETMKLGTSNFQGTGNLASFQFFANNDFNYNCQFSVDCTKFLPKTITYNDAGTSPMGDTLWMLLMPVWANGGQMASTQITCSMSWVAVYNYTDA